MEPSARRVAVRYFAAARIKYEVIKTPTEIWVGAETPDEEVGHINLAPLGGHELRYCEENVRQLRDEVFRGKDVPIWRVLDVEVGEGYRGSGVGMKLYERAFKKAKPAIIVTGGCTGMGTTTEAFRIWKNLGRKWPSKGSTPKDFVIAVR